MIWSILDTLTNFTLERAEANLQSHWKAWSELFATLPLGDPYLAAFSLILIATMIGMAMHKIMRYSGQY